MAPWIGPGLPLRLSMAGGAFEFWTRAADNAIDISRRIDRAAADIAHAGESQG
ncbi:hypothetical protein VA599_22975 [Chromobacterium sp. TRC.1.1.SA]|uniref:Uncharacterized protein n=1 Tax=Chromobacterium indicum TaxID=3110228 RepID=A0ABV0CR09_9NEIS